MGKKEEKTNVCRVLEQKKVSYKTYTYDSEITNGVTIAEILGENPDRVFKTLVTVGKSKTNYVFVIPVASELNLKKAASAVSEKSIEMIKQKELLPLTGYIHGGCSPIGMKKFFKTTIHISAKDYDEIFVSAGKVGHQVCISPKDLENVIPLSYADLTTE